LSSASWPARCLRGRILGGDPLGSVLGVSGLQFPDPAHQSADALPLGADLRVAGLEGVFGVERALPPGHLGLLIVLSLVSSLPVAGGRRSPRSSVNRARRATAG
jgi:hypothetical protein